MTPDLWEAVALLVGAIATGFAARAHREATRAPAPKLQEAYTELNSAVDLVSRAVKNLESQWEEERVRIQNATKRNAASAVRLQEQLDREQELAESRQHVPGGNGAPGPAGGVPAVPGAMVPFAVGWPGGRTG